MFNFDFRTPQQCLWTAHLLHYSERLLPFLDSLDKSLQSLGKYSNDA